jgi:hypothetical protein
MMTAKLVGLTLGALLIGGAGIAEAQGYPPQMTPDGQMIRGLALSGPTMPLSPGDPNEAFANFMGDRNYNLQDPYGRRYIGRNNVPQWVTPNGYVVGSPCQYCMRIR